MELLNHGTRLTISYSLVLDEANDAPNAPVAPPNASAPQAAEVKTSEEGGALVDVPLVAAVALHGVPVPGGRGYPGGREGATPAASDADAAESAAAGVDGAADPAAAGTVGDATILEERHQIPILLGGRMLPEEVSAAHQHSIA